MEQALRDLWEVLQCWLRQPVLLVEWLIVAAVLWGAGRSAGLPLLYWHESPRHGLLAGFGSGLLVGELVFVLYLMEGYRSFPGQGGLDTFIIAGLIPWVVVVLSRGCLLAYRRRERRIALGQSGLSAPGLLPAPSWPLVVGVSAALIVLQVLLRVGAEQYSEPSALTLAVKGLGNLLAPPPPPDVTDAERYEWLHGLAGITGTLLCVAYGLAARSATPALGISLLLAASAAVYGRFAFTRMSGLPALLLLAGLALGGMRRYKLRVGGLSSFYARPTHYPPRTDGDEPEPPQSVPPVPFAAGLPTNAGPRPLVVVCASGGGIRSAAWTAAILDQLERIEGLLPATRLITGASGGMVGATFFIARRYHEELARGDTQGPGAPLEAPASSASLGEDPSRAAVDPRLRSLVELVGSDSLSPTVKQLVLNDIPWALLPFRNRWDRGQTLEDAWLQVPGQDRALGGKLGLTFGELAELESAGRLPSLVFAPMIVEDGRRLLLTNRDLRSILQNHAWGLRLQAARAGQPCPSASSRSGYTISELFPGCLRQLRLTTAARLSAAFPYVSPAAILPTMPRSRVVDAGYFDNYGLHLLCTWLRECITTPETAALLREHVSKVLVIQIRDNVSRLGVNPDAEAPPPPTHSERSLPSILMRGLEGLTTPLSALMRAREAGMLFRNDAELESVSELLTSWRYGCPASQSPEPFVSTTVFDFRGEASLSWYLARHEVAGILEQARSSETLRKLGAVRRWMQQ